MEPEIQSNHNRRGTQIFSSYYCKHLYTYQQTQTPVISRSYKQKRGSISNMFNLTIILTEHFLFIIFECKIVIYTNGPLDKKLGVSGVSFSKDQRSSSKSSSSFSCYFCSRGILVYLYHSSWCVHIFRPLPTSMVFVSITHLHTQKNK